MFEQGQVERSCVCMCVCVLTIRLSPGETSPSDRANTSILSSCYKTSWPSAMGGGWVVGGTLEQYTKAGNLREGCHQRIWVLNSFLFLTSTSPVQMHSELLVDFTYIKKAPFGLGLRLGCFSHLGVSLGTAVAALLRLRCRAVLSGAVLRAPPSSPAAPSH